MRIASPTSCSVSLGAVQQLVAGLGSSVKLGVRHDHYAGLKPASFMYGLAGIVGIPTEKAAQSHSMQNSTTYLQSDLEFFCFGGPWMSCIPQARKDRN
jgi:hypothetical protein